MANDLVLMVDDELDNRVMMRHFLESWGYEVELAANGEEALEKVEARRPALVLLDLEMPVMDGLEACQRLKDNPITESIPVMMFTGLESTSDKVKGIRKGADDYVVKTVDPEEIQARIEMVLRRTRRYQATPSADEVVATDAVISGSLDEKSFPEAFQLAMAYGRSGTLLLRNANFEARVYLRDDDVVHAEAGEFRGEEAVYELALWNQGQFHYIVGEVATEVTIRQSGTSLLMEATRRMDEWTLISTKVPSFDVVPHRVAISGAEPIRLTRIDWQVASSVDGRKTIRRLAKKLDIDLWDVGRAIFGLVTAGVLAFEPDKNERDSFFDTVPELRPDPQVEEPYELSPVQWKLLASIDGKRDLGILTHLVGLPPRKMAECLKDLVERGFIRVSEQRARPASPSVVPVAGRTRDLEAQPDLGKFEAFTPRIRAIGFD